MKSLSEQKQDKKNMTPNSSTTSKLNKGSLLASLNPKEHTIISLLSPKPDRKQKQKQNQKHDAIRNVIILDSEPEIKTNCNDKQEEEVVSTLKHEKEQI